MANEGFQKVRAFVSNKNLFSSTSGHTENNTWQLGTWSHGHMTWHAGYQAQTVHSQLSYKATCCMLHWHNATNHNIDLPNLPNYKPGNYQTPNYHGLCSAQSVRYLFCTQATAPVFNSKLGNTNAQLVAASKVKAKPSKCHPKLLAAQQGIEI